MRSTVHNAALSLILRTHTLPQESRVLLDPLVRQVSRAHQGPPVRMAPTAPQEQQVPLVQPDLVAIPETLDQSALPVLWELLERMVRMGHLDETAHREHRAQLVRLELQVLPGGMARTEKTGPMAGLEILAQPVRWAPKEMLEATAKLGPKAQRDLLAWRGYRVPPVRLLSL